MNSQQLIKSLYKGLKSYYDYASNLEDAIFECGDDVEGRVFDNMPTDTGDMFDHKACRFLLADVEVYLKCKEEMEEQISLPEFVEAYQDLTMMQLWDFLVYNAYMLPVED